MVDVTFHGRDADVVNEPSPEPVTTAVQKKQASAQLEHTEHLGDCPILMRIMVETVGTGHHIKAAVGKWKPLTITLNRNGSFTERLPALTATGQHS